MAKVFRSVLNHLVGQQETHYDQSVQVTEALSKSAKIIISCVKGLLVHLHPWGLAFRELLFILREDGIVCQWMCSLKAFTHASESVVTMIPSS